MSIDNVSLFVEKGYVILKNIYSSTELNELEAIIDDIFSQWMNKNRERFIQEELINMYCLTSKSYFDESPQQRIKFFNFITHSNLVHHIEKLLGPSAYFHDTQLFFNPTNLEKPTYWHRDFQYSGTQEKTLIEELGKLKALHIRLALHSETGVNLIPGTHKRWDNERENSVRLQKNGFKSCDTLPNSKAISLERGDVLVFDAQMLHSGIYKGNTERKAFDICVGTPHPISTQGIYAEPLPSHEELNHIVNPSLFQNTMTLLKKKPS